MVKGTPSLAGLYFVTDKCGPAAGRVMGKLGSDVVSLLVESDDEPWQLFVPVSTLLEWELFEAEGDALGALARKVELCSARTNKKP